MTRQVKFTQADWQTAHCVSAVCNRHKYRYIMYAKLRRLNYVEKKFFVGQVTGSFNVHQLPTEYAAGSLGSLRS